MPSTGPQLSTGEYSRIHIQGSSKELGLPLSVWIQSGQFSCSVYKPGQTINSLPVQIFTVLLLLVLGLILVEQHQPSRGETEPLPTLNTLHLPDSCLYRDENCVSPYACPVNPAQELPHKQEIPAFKGLRAQGWMQCNTDSQNYWGGKAPLRITKPIPCLKQGPSKEAVSRWALMISKKCSITYHISYLWSVITLTTNRGLSSLFFPPHASIHCVQCLYSSGISSGVVIDQKLTTLPEMIKKKYMKACINIQILCHCEPFRYKVKKSFSNYSSF